MDNKDIKSLCLRLLHANTEEEVITILTDAGLWDNPDYWRVYGDDPSNYSAAGNQADIAMAALVEKITNSRDAILMNACFVNNIDPRGKDAPRGIRAAVAKFFDDSAEDAMAGQVREWTRAKRRQVAQNISVFLTGHRPSDGCPSISIADRGEGQTPLQIPNTILSLGRKNKRDIPFVHGKWNMGGTAALLYCGDRNLQLVVSRRNPKIIELHKGATNDTDDNWGFTIVRRDDPSGINDTSIYRYLAPINIGNEPSRGDILSFKSDTFPIFPKGEEPYALEVEWGTLIKLYEYQVKQKQMIGGKRGSILRPLDLLAPNLGIPFRLHECRYGGPTRSRVHQVNGLIVRLAESQSLEQDFPDSQYLTVDGENLSITIYAFKDNLARTYRDADKGIIFTLNGQSQGWERDSFFTRKKVGLGFLRRSLLVVVDCSDLSSRAQERLFVNDRVHIRKEGPFWEKLESEIIDFLGHHHGLKELQQERQRKLAQNKLDDSKPLETVLGVVFKNSSALSKIFLKGERLSSAFRSKKVKSKKVTFRPKTFPTFFKFLKLEYGEVLQRNASQGTKSRIFFETNAPNDYLRRKTRPGVFELLIDTHQGWKKAEELGYDRGLNFRNGIATLNVNIPGNIPVGTVLKFRLYVTDPIKSNGPESHFENDFSLTVIPKPKTTKGKTSSRREPPSPEHGKDRTSEGGVKFPKILKVYEDDWAAHEFDKFSGMRAVKTMSEESQTEFTFFVNMDNLYIGHEIKDDIKNEQVIKGQFEFGMALLGISLIYDDQEHKSEEEKFEGIEDRIFEFSRAMAPILIPMIREFGKLDLSQEYIEHLTN